MLMLSAYIPEMILTRRELHRYPEIAWTEFMTTQTVVQRVRDLGFKTVLGKKLFDETHAFDRQEKVIKGAIERAKAQGMDEGLLEEMDEFTGCMAVWETGRPGPVTALRFDMDCVNVQELATDEHVPAHEGFASKNDGLMHACGHDAHTAIGLAVAHWVKDNADKLTGTIKLVFQPAEEGVRGAMPMEKAGAVEGVDQIFGMHIGFQANKLGKVICGTKNFLATTKADITFTGVPAHAGNAPEEGKNALLAAATALLNMHAIPRSGKGDTRITVGKLIGGEGRNVIPPKAVLVLETRGITSALDEYMFGEVKRIAKAAADMWGCGYSIDIKGGTKSGESDLEVAEVVAEEARAMGCFDNVIVEQNFGASEDYSHFMSTVQANGGKGTYVQVGSNLSAGHHNGHFDFDEKAMEDSLVLMARCVYRTLAK